MKNVKRVLAFLLSVLMVVSCVPNIIFAETGDEVSAVEDTAAGTVTDPYAYRDVQTINMYTTERPYDAGMEQGTTFGATFALGVDRRLKSVSLPLWTYANNSNYIKVELWSGSRYGEGSLLHRAYFRDHQDGQTLTFEMPQNKSFEGALWFCVTLMEGTGMISPKGANASANGAVCHWQSANNPFMFTIETADVPIDTYKYAEVNFAQHTTDPIVEFDLSKYTVNEAGKVSKIDFKTPNDRGFLTVEGVESDPYFVIGEDYKILSNSEKYLGYQLAQVPASKTDYIVIKYRTSNVQTGTFYASHGSTGYTDAGGHVSFNYNPSGEWETLIVNAHDVWGKDATNSLEHFRFDFSDAATTDGKNPVMDIAYIRFYSSLEGAEACVEAEKHSLVALPITIRDYRADGMLFEYSALDPDLTGYPNHNLGNNGGFALTALIGSRNADLILGQYDPEVRQKFEELVALRDENGNDYTYVANGTGSNVYQPEPAPIEIILNSGAKQDVYGAELRYDLVEAELGENGKPVYRQGVVEFIAWYLEKLLPVPEKTDGKTNMNFIKGEADQAFDGKDLATYLREKLSGAQSGTYEETKAKAKDLVNGQGLNSVETYMDAAYFLLHNTFVDNPGYGMTSNEYNTLNLVAKTDENGNVRYVFSTAFDNVIYDRIDGIIQNSQFEIATQRRLNGNTGDWYYHRGNKQPVGCFDPLFGLGYDVNGASREQDTYRKMLGTYDSNPDKVYYENTNFHYTMEGHAHFVYHYSENLYFTFIGDDDVYLYVNGKRIVDVGGTHPISKVMVSLNDVAEVCGLEEGGIYSFDFFYMERHGTAANLSIETNIRVADVDMITEKKAYQNGQEIDYDGVVDYTQPVDYVFSVYNNSQVPLTNLTFSDADIGATLSYKTDEAMVLPQNGKIADLTVTRYNADGTVAESVNGLDEAGLRAYLVAGIAVGERLTISGIKYTVSADKWVTQDGKTYFVNHLYTTATVESDNVTEKVVSGTDYHRVNKAEYVFESMHVYDWGKLDTVKADGTFVDSLSSGVIVELDAILDVMRKNEVIQKAYPNGMNAADFDFALTSPSGNTVGEDINKYVTELESGEGFYYRGPKCGVDTFYVTVSRDGIAYPPVRVDVYVYGIAENVFVLDYNLPITINTQEHGILNNDILSLNVNPNSMTLKVEFPDFGEENSLYFTNNYGTFTLDGEGETADITYTLRQFMNGVDTLKIKVSLVEEGKDGVTYLTGVTMEQVVTFAPANVMYYEDDFVGEGAITYINKGTDENGNIWAVYDTPEKMDHQSPDQSENYGFDDGYSWPLSDVLEFNPDYIRDADPDKIQAMLDEVVYGPEEGMIFGDASNDTIHLLKVNEASNSEVLSFEFIGTGFELLSRTTMQIGYDEEAEQPITTYAVLTVRVDRYNEKEDKWELCKAIPVISESFGGDLTQIPLVVLKNLEYDHYKVTVYASNVREQIRLFFVDGVRVYQPLTDEQEALYYKADEKNVTFTEIKTEISKGNIVYGSVSPNKTDEEKVEFIQTWGYGNTMIEDQDGSFVLVATNPDDENLTPYEQYMYFGPNNEIYLSAAVDGSALSYIAFYVTKDENYVGERSIQVGAHLKATTDYEGDDDEMYTTSLLYGGLSANFEFGYSVHSGTEQYFSIDVNCLASSTENGIEKYLVIIGTDDSNGHILALTNLKLNGYSILGGGTAAAELEAVQDVSDVNASMLACQTYNLVCKYMKAN